MHCHAAMTLLRGFADDVSLEDWLSQYIWPAEGRWIGEEYIEDGTKVARTHARTARTHNVTNAVAAGCGRDAALRCDVLQRHVLLPARERPRHLRVRSSAPSPIRSSRPTAAPRRYDLIDCGLTPHSALAGSYGMRSAIGIPVIAFPSNWANDADDYIEKGA